MPSISKFFRLCGPVPFYSYMWRPGFYACTHKSLGGSDFPPCSIVSCSIARLWRLTFASFTSAFVFRSSGGRLKYCIIIPGPARGGSWGPRLTRYDYYRVNWYRHGRFCSIWTGIYVLVMDGSASRKWQMFWLFVFPSCCHQPSSSCARR